MQVQAGAVLVELLPSHVMSIVTRLFGCFGRGDDTHHHSHSSSFDSTKQQHIVDAGAATSAARRKSSNGKAPLRVRFNVPVNEVFKGSALHAPLKELLVYIIKEGLRVSDLFRRPGNSADMKCIMKQLADGRPVDWTEYNFYTVANTAKKFLLNMPGGIFGADCERAIIETIDSDESARIRTIGSRLQVMPCGARQFLVLLFGAWYLTVYGCGSNNNPNTTTSNASNTNGAAEASAPPCRASLAIQLEAVSKSVCGSLFHSCDEPRKVDRAVEILKTMISQFANPLLHGADMLDYFARVTGFDVRKSPTESCNVAEPATVQPAAYIQSARPPDSVCRNASRASHVSRHSSKRADAAARMAATVDIAPVNAEYLQAVSTPDFLIVHVHVDLGSSGAVGSNQPGLLQIAPVSGSVNGHGNGCSRNQPRSLAVGADGGCDAHLLHIRTPVSRFNSVRRRQLERLKKRSEWFREVPHTPTISLSTLFHERWRAAIEQLEVRQWETERSAGIADLHTAHSGPEMDTAAAYSPYQFVNSLLTRATDEDSLDTPVSEPLRRACLGSRRELPPSPLGDTNVPNETRKNSITNESAARNTHVQTADSAKGRKRVGSRKEPSAPCIVADEPSSSVTVERFEFEPCVSDDEHWSANTVL